MNNFAELVTNRRSIRKYTEESLQSYEVEQIMKAALMSPSSKHSNPWQFVLVENKETLKKLACCKSSGCGFIENCALAIVVLTDPMQSGAYVEDASIAATYIQLQAEDLGLGSCWVQIRGRETEAGQDSEDYIRQLLNIPLQMCIGCIIAIGYKEKPGKPHPEEDLQWEKIHIETYHYDE
ncbi:NAD(P)H nitroreductase [Bacteroidia bacterium]|nr:NAD(P)H nitroreductase [Bacteroidia bacterium]GHV20199.1 NAD(P)H nitroreductase [Bacteroidia bacterium]